MDVVEEEVISKIVHKSAALRLINHPRNGRIKNTKGAYYWLDRANKWRPLSGVLPRLDSVYWSKASYFEAQRLKRQKEQRLRAGTLKKKRQKRSASLDATEPEQSHGHGRHYGTIRGTEVHRQLQDFIELDPKNYLKKHRNSTQSFMKRIMTYILRYTDWEPLRAEFDVFDETLRIGTSIDMVCVNREGRLIFIEIKTGYRNYFDDHSGYMAHSLSKLTDSPRHQAYIQLMTACMFVVRNHGIPVSRMALYVLRVDEDDVYPYPIDNDYFERKMPLIYQDLLTVGK